MNNEFSTLADILSDPAFSNTNFEKNIGKALNKTTIFEFWPKIVGKKFANFSMPYNIKGSTLYVSVKNATIIQEFTFFKSEILNKLKMYAQPLGVEIHDIRIDYKNWGRTLLESSSEISDVDFTPDYTEEELNSVEFTKEEIDEFDRLIVSIENMDFADTSLKQKYFNNILNQHRAKKLRKMQDS